jgi:hypothetical protein
MKKWATLFIALLFASPVSAQIIHNPSTNARMDGLGVSNHQINDDFNIWINPAQVNNYKNAVYGELGMDPCGVSGGSCGSGTSNTGHNERNKYAFGGLNVDTMTGTWGAYIGRPYVGPFSTLDILVPGTAPIANRFDLFYAPPNAPVGFYVSYANVSDDISDPDDLLGFGPVDADYDHNEYNFGAGGIFADGMLEAAVDVGITSAEVNGSDAPTLFGDLEGEEDVTTVSFLARHHGEAAGGILLTTGQVVWMDFDKSEETVIDVRVDTTLNSHPNENTLFVAGIGVEYLNVSNTIDDTYIAIPVNLGLEHQTFKKVQTRFGVSKPIYSSGDLEGPGDFQEDFVEDGAATTSLGLGWMVTDNLTVDAVLNQDVLFTGTYLISGIPESLSSKLSATWRFQ